MISIYEKGMRKPLPFFPESSYAFACNEQNKSKEKKAKDDLSNETKGIIEARKKWVSGEHHRGEGEDSANQLCFRDEPFKDPEFENLAFEIYEKFIEIKEQKRD